MNAKLNGDTTLTLRLLPVFLLLFFGALGCKSVQPADVIGTWVLKDASRKFLPTELQSAAPKFVLNADGTFVAADMPGLFYFPRRHAARLESGRGVWKLVSREGKQQLQLDFQVIAGWKDALPYGTQLDALRGTIFYFFGDPDDGRRIEFERETPTP